MLWLSVIVGGSIIMATVDVRSIKEAITCSLMMLCIGIGSGPRLCIWEDDKRKEEITVEQQEE